MELNEVKLIGRLTRDPEASDVGQTRLCKFGLAVNTTFGKDKSETAFLDCESWGTTAQTIEKYCEKGREILVSGRLKQSTWEKDGQKHSRIVVVVDRFSFGRSKGEGNNGGSAGDSGDAAPAPARGNRGQGRRTGGGVQELF